MSCEHHEQSPTEPRTAMDFAASLIPEPTLETSPGTTLGTSLGTTLGTSPGTTPPRVLTVCGSDSGGCAGLQSELRTFALLGIHALTAITTVTAQNSVGVQHVHPIPTEIVIQQINSVYWDIGFQVAKTGVILSSDLIAKLAEHFCVLNIGRYGTIPLIVDPIIASASGKPFIDQETINALCTRLIPLATIVTPNLEEVRIITGIVVDDLSSATTAAQHFLDLGAHSVLLKGGHGNGEKSIDYFFTDHEQRSFIHPRIANGGNDHGAGDTLAAAICAALAYNHDINSAIDFATDWAYHSILAAYPLGNGRGPANAMWKITRN